MQQVVDLQRDEDFRGLDIALASISPDPLEAWRAEGDGFGISTPMLSDTGNDVASRFGVMRWAMPSNEPGHTFVLVDADGIVRWIKDYGAPENGGAMYVAPTDLTPAIRSALADA